MSLSTVALVISATNGAAALALAAFQLSDRLRRRRHDEDDGVVRKQSRG